MATVKLGVHGMRGPGCGDRIVDALRSVPGVFAAVASPHAGCVEVDFEDDEVSVERLVEAIAHAGYRAELTG
jgi:copper chaperone CopZ